MTMVRTGMMLVLVFMLCVTACSKGNEAASGGRKLQVVTTLFPAL